MFRFISFLVGVFFLFSLSFAKASQPADIDDQEPTLMLIPLKNFVDFLSLGIEGGNAHQELLSENGELHSKDSTSTYSVSLAKKLGDDLIVSVRLGPTRVPLILISTNLNIQYDIIKNDFCKFSASAMYGGILFPGPRYGAGVLGSCFFKAWGTVGAVFLSYQSLVDKKQFQLATSEGVGYSVINYVEADIKYNIALLGVEYLLPGHGLERTSLLLSFGSQTLTDTQITYEEHAPSGYSMGNGSWAALEFRVYFP